MHAAAKTIYADTRKLLVAMAADSTAMQSLSVDPMLQPTYKNVLSTSAVPNSDIVDRLRNSVHGKTLVILYTHHVIPSMAVAGMSIGLIAEVTAFLKGQ